nr:hypothetical protein [Tanacetum cinerariifolium]
MYHALIESLLADEERMDQGVTNLLKKKSQHDDQDEDPSAGPNKGKKTKRRRTKDYESSKNLSTSKDQPQDELEPKTNRAPRHDWFTQPPRPPTLDPK